MAGREQSNAMRAGAFVVVSVLLAVFIIMTLSGIRDRLTPANSYTVRFDLAVGAQGLSEGSEVRIGGQKVGQVAGVRFASDDDDEMPEFVDVKIRIPRKLKLHEGAAAQLEVPLLGSTSVLNFPSLGDASAPIIERGGVVKGQLAAPAFLASAGYGPEQRNQLQHALSGMDEIVTRVNEGVVPELEGIVKDVSGRSGIWLDHIDSAALDAKDLIAGLKAMMVENRASVETSIANIESATGTADEVASRVKDEMVDAAMAMLDNGRETAIESRELIASVDALVREQTPSVRRSFANLRMTSEQFKLASMEIRRAPWRLLNRPDTKEMEYELLYDSARAYADAVSNLRGASESLEAATIGDGSRLALDGQTIDDLAQSVGSAFNEYEDAEEKFLGLLLEKATQ